MNPSLLELRIDFRSPQAAFLQLAHQVQAAIEDGRLQPGERLPTVRELAGLLDVHFNTIARAYRVLDEAGWITTVRGRGTFVEPGSGSSPESPPVQVRLEAQARVLLDTAVQAGWTIQQTLDLIRRIAKDR